jgi:hypothetical protein
VLVARAGVHVGRLPSDLPIANTAVDWSGTRWTMVMAGALSENIRPRLRLMGHEAFHRIQPKLRLEATGPPNNHLDTREGRYWLQLEWNALQRALATTGVKRREAIADAALFRFHRRTIFPASRTAENALEIHEGLAEYAGARLLEYSDSLVGRMVASRRAGETQFVRSFAYISGPLYGFLLDDMTAGAWRRTVTSQSDLGAMLLTAMKLPAPASDDARLVSRRASLHGGDTLAVIEDRRDHERRELVAEWQRTLIDGPVLLLDLKRVRSSAFDPGLVFPFGPGKTVYRIRTLTADWGELAVEGGAVLEGSETARVSLIGASADRLSGAGWKLTPAPGWRVVPSSQVGDFELRSP